MTQSAAPISDMMDAESTPAPENGSPARGETDRLDPEATDLVLSSGTHINVLPLRMRQLFRLLRIVTRGGAQYLPMLRNAMASMDSEDSADEFGVQLVAVMVMALPEAEDEAVDFIMSVVEPFDLRVGRDKQTKEHNEDLRQQLHDELFNPELDDIISIVEKVILTEKDDLVALGKRLSQTFSLAQKMDPTE